MTGVGAGEVRTIRVLAALAAVVLVATAASPADASSARKKKHHKPAYAVSETVSRSSAVPGTVVTVSGHVAPKAKGKRVTLQRRLGTGGWVPVAHTTLPRSSSYVLSVRLSSAGHYGLRTVVPKSRKRRAGVSAVRSVSVAAPVVWRSVSAGGTESCGLKSDGSLWCWGLNRYGELGSGSNVGTDIANPKPQRVGTGTSWVAVVVGEGHSCALRSDHTAWCWGLNLYGELGNPTHAGTSTPNTTPLQVGGGASWASLSTGSIARHTCGVRLDHTLWCWGQDLYGQLGDGNSGSATERHTPNQVGSSATWSQVSAGGFHTCARKVDGTLWCWGDGSDGAVGNGSAGPEVTTPVQVGSGADWVTVVAGAYQSCATRTDRSLWCWGYNYYGEVGSSTNTGTTTPVTSPVQVGTATDWAAPLSGRYQSCARKIDASAWCFGSNHDGQLGNATSSGTTSANAVPLAVTGGPTWTQLSAGDDQTCGVRRDGTAWCWGLNFYGQLGNLTHAGVSVPDPTPLKVG